MGGRPCCIDFAEMLIDSHCHLDAKNFRDGPLDPITRARSAGVTGFICVGVGETDSQARQAVALSESREDVLAVVGGHPHDASSCNDAVFDSLRSLAQGPRVIAVGEIGLDYHYDFSPRDIQQELFRKFLGLARQLKKPVVIHTREAAADTLSILAEQNASEIGGVFHCFSEDVAFARRALDMNFDISFSGIVTFPKANELHEVAKFVPDDRYFVETDSPYLAPIPKRGKRCEPAYVVYTARHIADLRGQPYERVAEQTTANVCRRFNLKNWPPSA